MLTISAVDITITVQEKQVMQHFVKINTTSLYKK